ncbi:MAG: hypothetical protein AABW82_05265 [Nanoarchaeota archaeon]
MNNKRGMKLFALFAFLSILLILSTVIVSAQTGGEYQDFSETNIVDDEEPQNFATPAFNYKNQWYLYNESSNNYKTNDGKKSFSDVPYGASDFIGFKEGFKVEPGFFDNFGDKFASSSFIKYVFGTRGSDNIFQRGFAFIGYGDELKEYTSARYCLIYLDTSTKKTTLEIISFIVVWIFFLILVGFLITHFIKKKEGNTITIIIGLVFLISSLMFCAGIGPIARGLGAIYLAGILCWTLLELLKKIIGDVDIEAIKEVSESIIFKFKSAIAFANAFTLIFGSIYILLNIPGISILKPLFWPLFTDYGISISFPFALEVSNSVATIANLSYWTDYITILAPLIGLMALRALVFSLMSFLILVVIAILIKGRKLITDMIIHYQSEKRRIKMQQRVDNLSYLAQAADIFANAGKKPRN